MEMNAATVLSPRLPVPNPPGMTPLRARVGVPAAWAALRPAVREGGRTGRDEGQPAPAARHKVLALLEDGVLLLGIVFMVPVVIVLLALPFAFLLQVAAEIGRRW